MQEIVRKLLQDLGEDPTRQGLVKTPERVESSLKYLTSGYNLNPEEIIKSATFAEKSDEMVIVKNIEFFSLCEHHMLPFFGKAHIGYIPNGHVIGLSKIPRVVDIFARRLQLQERLTTEIAGSLQRHLKPQGVGVIMEASHLCMMMRGVMKTGSTTVTSAMQGNFKTDHRTRQEFLTLIKDN